MMFSFSESEAILNHRTEVYQTTQLPPNVIQFDHVGDVFYFKYNSLQDLLKDVQGIGISVDDYYVLAKATEGNEGFGVGVYYFTDPSSDLSALWTSTENNHLLGIGTASRKENSTDFEGEYRVHYAVRSEDAGAYDLQIQKIAPFQLKIYWRENGLLLFSGVGLQIENALYFAWGPPNYAFPPILYRAKSEHLLMEVSDGSSSF